MMVLWKVLVLCPWLVLLITSHSAAQNCTVDYDLRLVQTLKLNTTNSGRLEVCIDGVWGTVQANGVTSFWPIKNVLVACRGLGYPSGLNSVISSQVVGGGVTGQPVHLGQVVCDGTESSLEDCEGVFLSDTTSSHNLDIYIVCLPGTDIYSGLHTLSGGVVLEGEVRLVGSSTNGRGVVEIYTLLGWASICPDSEWTSADARFICRNLGYESGDAEVISVADPSSVATRMLYDAQCERGQPFVITRLPAGDCTFLTDFSSSCVNDLDSTLFAGVSCRSSGEEGSARLFNSIDNNDDTFSGIVEVLYDGRWGPVCTTDSTAVAEVACEGFGFRRDGGFIISASTVFPGVESRLKPIWFPDVTCSDDATSLSTCTPALPIGYGTCFDVLAVQCSERSLSGGAIAGIVITCLVAVGAVIWFFVYGKPAWQRRRNSKWYNSCWCKTIRSCKCPKCHCHFPTPRAATLVVTPTPAPPEPVEPEPTALPNHGVAVDLPPPYPGPPSATSDLEKSPYPPGPAPAYSPGPMAPGACPPGPDLYPPNAAYPPATYPS